MADTIREALSLDWQGTDSRQEASVDGLRAVVTRDLTHLTKSFVYAAMVWNGPEMLLRSLRYSTNVGSLDAAKALCEMAIGAEMFRRATG